MVTNGDVVSSHTETTLTPADTDDALDAVQPVVPIAHVELTDISVSTDRQMGANDDMVMRDGPAKMKKPTNDENLPPWLLPMIKYLCGVAVDTAWQNLITEFVEFEKGSPPAGVCSFLFVSILHKTWNKMANIIIEITNEASTSGGLGLDKEQEEGRHTSD